ncbi:MULTISPECIES: UDP-glucose 4-epimerase GalE [unclassified Mesorhizobium]|uniref:UDP-glucose 4-epimerase GalE n=1 Tax=unclassified Mesorhizobium TaxID=325217 RepID=UPI0009668255|nr:MULTISPECIES: UDP-glucose 4-epimerase GalE [unclassified Mesorhizobium]MBN9253803.1 UDP-glucose 4-epimerase GalE [Mesorhizobium sp.]OJX73456.1 MAG: UDP-glucose 4-epimerase GalE [Mesorhizobium sp. 65-26]
MNSKPAILVTGGAGFIGSHTCKALAARGYLPVVYDNLERGNAKAVRWGPLIVDDIRNKKGLEQAFADHQPVAVIHFAALAYVGESVSDPGAYYSTNVAGTLTLLEVARAAGVDKMIFSSSCATYGIPDALPIRESARQEPINPYGRTKLFCEKMIEDWAAAYGLKYVILRYFNACGSDPEGELGEWHTPETHLIPRMLLAAARKIDHLEVFGSDYDTSDGTCIRDYIHVSDLAQAHVKALGHLVDGGENIAANIGTGRGVSIREILDIVAEQTGRTVPVAYKARRPGDPPELFADATKAREVLRFVPEYSDMNTVIATAAPFFGLEFSGRRTKGAVFHDHAASPA